MTSILNKGMSFWRSFPSISSQRAFTSQRNSKLALWLFLLALNTNFLKEVATVFEPLPPKRNGVNVMDYLHRQLLEKYDPTGKRRALVDQQKGIRAGDILKVSYLDRTNVIGQVIAIKRGHNNVAHNVLLRNKFNKLGIEIRVPIFNPKIKNIEILYKPKEYLSRRKQFYIRNSKYDVGDVENFLRKERKSH